MDVKLIVFKSIKIPCSGRGFLFFLVAFLSFGLFGCASSTVSRSAGDQVNSAYESSNARLAHAGDDDPAEAYQNSPQTTKGVVVGSAAGALTGVVFAGTAGLLPGVAGGAALGGFLGAYIDSRTTLRDQIENRGVKVMVLGDQVKLVLASDQVFRGMSNNIVYSSLGTLDAVAKYINMYRTMLVTIDTYTNDSGDKQVNCLVSQQQATAIEKYLWPRLNTRVLTAHGHGGTDLLEANSLSWTEGINYRVEITFEKLPV